MIPLEEASAGGSAAGLSYTDTSAVIRRQTDYTGIHWQIISRHSTFVDAISDIHRDQASFVPITKSVAAGIIINVSGAVLQSLSQTQSRL